MAGLKFDDIENAFQFVSAAPYGANSAYLNLETGAIFYQSEMTGIDELDGKTMDWDQLIEIPHKNDLGLGQALVFEFVEVNLPDDYHRVRAMFQRQGAYSRYKGFLESKGMLRAWHRFTNEREEKTLRPGARRIRFP